MSDYYAIKTAAIAAPTTTISEPSRKLPALGVDVGAAGVLFMLSVPLLVVWAFVERLAGGVVEGLVLLPEATCVVEREDIVVEGAVEGVVEGGIEGAELVSAGATSVVMALATVGDAEAEGVQQERYEIVGTSVPV